MALVEVYGGQRSLAFELATADNYGNSHSNSGDDSVENEVMQRIYCNENSYLVNTEDDNVEDEICLKLTWSHMLLKKTVY